MKLCMACAKPIYLYNRSGYCKPCRMRNRSAEQVAQQQAARLATVASRTPEQRLAKFQIMGAADECWGWSGCHNGVGYPVLRISKRIRVATQVALETSGRARPSPDHVACHSCDNPICTNPAHLWWGTEKENMQDAANKGRLSGRRTRAKPKQGFPIAEVRDAA